MKKADKELYVSNLTEELKTSSSVVIIDYSGLTVKMQQDLKKKLSEVNASMVVVKNTLLKLAGKKAKIPQDSLTDTVLSGQTAIVVTQKDPIAPLQVLTEFAKQFSIPQLRVGIIEGSFQSKEGLSKLSKFPGKEALFGQAIGTISAPLYSFISTLQANMQNLISVLEQASKQE